MEEDLIVRAQAGDSAAFRTLVEQFAPKAWGVARILVHDHTQAEDALQESWVDVWRGMHRFDARRPFCPWLLAVVGNRCRMYARQRHVATLALDDRASEELPDPHDDFAKFDSYGPSAALSQALSRLSTDERALLALRYQADLELAEIAALYDQPLSTIKSRLYRLLSALRVQLNGCVSPLDSAETIA
jgi:RNA polymerase sigma factor (sigma-70 family)